MVTAIVKYVDPVRLMCTMARKEGMFWFRKFDSAKLGIRCGSPNMMTEKET